MVIVNLKDSTTRKFDLQQAADRAAFNSLGRDPKFLALVTALWIKTDAHSNTLPIPKKFHKFTFACDLLLSRDPVTKEPRGEIVTMQADDISVVVTSYYGKTPQMTRIDVQRTGKLRWAPEGGETHATT